MKPTLEIAANSPTDRYLFSGMPASTADCRLPSFCSLRTNETVSDVPAGVVPKTVAPGRSGALIPEGTWVGAFGLGVEARAGPDVAARGASSAPTPSKTPAASRVW